MHDIGKKAEHSAAHDTNLSILQHQSPFASLLGMLINPAQGLELDNTSVHIQQHTFSKLHINACAKRGRQYSAYDGVGDRQQRTNSQFEAQNVHSLH